MTTTVQLEDLRESFTESQIVNNESEGWSESFRTLFDNKIAMYKNGIQNVGTMFSMEEENFLHSIGATPQEIFDFVEDWCDDGVPDPETILAITKIRRDYFIQEQHSQWVWHPRHPASFPGPYAELAGLPWFPRIIEKARAKLQGELPSDLMYCCGGDRRFLRTVSKSPVEFLQVVWDAGDETDRIVKFVTDHHKISSESS